MTDSTCPCGDDHEPGVFLYASFNDEDMPVVVLDLPHEEDPEKAVVAILAPDTAFELGSQLAALGTAQAVTASKLEGLSPEARREIVELETSLYAPAPEG